MRMPPSNSPLASMCLVAVLIAGAPLPLLAQPSRNQGNTHLVPMVDKAFDTAAAEARRAFPVFLAKWKTQPAGYSAFRVKAGFRTDDGLGEEYLWFQPEVVSADGRITGRLSNDATRISKLTTGAQIQVDAGKVVDWMYLKGGKMYGQFTMRAQLSRATPQQRAQFEAVLSPTPLESGDH
jgi:uncharacterized protein YegJ (DUF2314 family)